jgi:hypothetical protein
MRESTARCSVYVLVAAVWMVVNDQLQEGIWALMLSIAGLAD